MYISTDELMGPGGPEDFGNRLRLSSEEAPHDCTWATKVLVTKATNALEHCLVERVPHMRGHAEQSA